jgi:hypothetical protein
MAHPARDDEAESDGTVNGTRKTEQVDRRQRDSAPHRTAAATVNRVSRQAVTYHTILVFAVAPATQCDSASHRVAAATVTPEYHAKS